MAISITDREEPILPIPKRENVEPNLAKLLNDSDEPR
jgi:hypothetical protein